MTYEEKLLIRMCKREKIESLDYSRVNWVNLLLQSTVHLVEGVLYSQFCVDPNTPKWFQFLTRQAYYFNKDVGQRRTKLFLDLLSAFSKAGLEVLVLKGMVLASCLYHDYGVRSFSDLDILVKPRDIQKIHKVLKEQGYIQGEYDFKNDKLVPCPEKTILERATELQHESPFFKIERSAPIPIPLSVEIHCRLETVFDRFVFETEPLFDRKRKYSLNKMEVYSLSNEDMLMHLCYHNYWHTQSVQDIYKHKDIILRQYMDIRLFIKSNNINWNNITALRSSDIWLPISYSLYFCHKIFEDVLPESVLAYIDADFLEDEEKNIYDRWITKRDEARCFGRFETDFLDRVFDMNRYEMAIRSCDFGSYMNQYEVQQYFKFFSTGEKVFLLPGLNNENK